MSVQQDLVLPSRDVLERARSTLLTSLPSQGIGHEQAQKHLEKDIVPALNGNSKSPRYYGFVTGGSTPIATFADKLAVEEDQNVQVHLPNETVATNVEDAALRLLCDLVNFNPSDWPHRTFTTGATASNVVGLACGREHVIAEAARRNGKEASIARDGLIVAVQRAQIHQIQILTTVPHSSIRKAASILGLGHTAVLDVSDPSMPHQFSHEALEKALALPNTASIISISAAEVNTGFFATTGAAELTTIRSLADKYGSWIHVDAAFGQAADEGVLQLLGVLDNRNVRLPLVPASDPLVDELGGLPVRSLFNPNDLPGYASHDGVDCPWCRAGWAGSGSSLRRSCAM